MIANRWLRRAADALETATAGMTDEALLWHPEGKWSTANILEHLARAYGSTAYILDKCVNERRTVASPPSWRQRVMARLVVTLGYLPSGVPAPEVTRPEGLAPADALRDVRAAIAALDAAAIRSVAHFGPHVRVANHPLLGGFTTSQWQRFHWVHTRHHLRQLAALRAAHAARR